MPLGALELSFQFHFFRKMDSDRGVHWVVDYLELRGYHDHVLLLKWVDHVVYERLVGAWSKLLACHDVFFMLVPR